MKKLKQTRQLRLKLETIKILTSRDLKRAVGGNDIKSSDDDDSYCTVETFRQIDETKR